MKLATYDDGSRDGQLVVVSRDQKTAHYATGIAGRLQQVLDDWNFLAPQLEALSLALENGKARHAFDFDPRRCSAPLPRAGVWAEPDQAVSGGPLLIGRADASIGPHSSPPALLAEPPSAADLVVRAQLAVLTGDVEPAAPPESALDGVRLVLLACSLCWDEANDRAGIAQAIAFAPVALTPDELGDAWTRNPGGIELRLRLHGQRDIQPDGAAESPPPLGELLHRAARWSGLRAGALIGCGPSRGASLRLPAPPPGERLRIDVDPGHAAGGQPFGTIELTLGAPA